MQPLASAPRRPAAVPRAASAQGRSTLHALSHPLSLWATGRAWPAGEARSLNCGRVVAEAEASPLVEGARRGAPRAQGAPNRSGGGLPRACSATKQTRRWCSLRRRDARAVRWESGQKSTKDTLRCAWVVLELSRPQCWNRPDNYSACCLVLPRALRRSSRARGKQLQSAPPTPSSYAFARPRDRLTRLGAPVCRSSEPGIEAR